MKRTIVLPPGQRAKHFVGLVVMTVLSGARQAVAHRAKRSTPTSRTDR